MGGIVLVRQWVLLHRMLHSFTEILTYMDFPRSQIDVLIQHGYSTQRPPLCAAENMVTLELQTIRLGSVGCSIQ